MTSPGWGVPGVLVLSALVGCAAPVVDGVQDDADEAAAVQGFVVIERVAAEGATQTSVSAKFVRVEAADDVALATELVGSALWLPEIGTCAPVDETGATAIRGNTADLPSPIKLLDVGDVTVKIRDAQSTGTPELSLARRAFPDVGDLISGVFYTSPDADRDLPAPASYSVESTGSESLLSQRSESPSLDGFVIEAAAPAPPAGVKVANQLLGRNRADATLLLEVEADLPIAWEVANGTEDDVIYVDVVSASSGVGLRCTFVDSGEATLPGSMMVRRHFTNGDANLAESELNVSLHRVRTEVLEGERAPNGIDHGEVRFDLSVVGSATLVSPI